MKAHRITKLKATGVVGLFIVLLGWVVLGCGHQAGFQVPPGAGRMQVSFPRLKFEPGEFVQAIDLEIRHGRVVAINRLLDDWDLEVVWDHPGLLQLKLAARHFPAGLADLRLLDDFITVENTGDEGFTLQAGLHTESIATTGRGDKSYTVATDEFRLKPFPGPPPHPH